MIRGLHGALQSACDHRRLLLFVCKRLEHANVLFCPRRALHNLLCHSYLQAVYTTRVLSKFKYIVNFALQSGPPWIGEAAGLTNTVFGEFHSCVTKVPNRYHACAAF